MVNISDSSNVNISFTLPCLNISTLTFDTKDLSTPMVVMSLTENGENTERETQNFTSEVIILRRTYMCVTSLWISFEDLPAEKAIITSVQLSTNTACSK